MAKVTRKIIIETLLANNTILSMLTNALDADATVVIATLDKWNNALTKASNGNSKEKAENEDIIINQIVPFVLAAEKPVTAKDVNDNFIHASRTNKASAMLRRAIEMGLISRDRVRKNANFEYAEPNFDWNEYISEYDKKVAEKAAARIAKARANRS